MKAKHAASAAGDGRGVIGHGEASCLTPVGRGSGGGGIYTPSSYSGHRTPFPSGSAPPNEKNPPPNKREGKAKAARGGVSVAKAPFKRGRAGRGREGKWS